jgi:hypothetical protein
MTLKDGHGVRGAQFDPSHPARRRATSGVNAMHAYLNRSLISRLPAIGAAVVASALVLGATLYPFAMTPAALSPNGIAGATGSPHAQAAPIPAVPVARSERPRA